VEDQGAGTRKEAEGNSGLGEKENPSEARKSLRLLEKSLAMWADSRFTPEPTLQAKLVQWNYSN